jgi:hypothetical protein
MSEYTEIKIQKGMFNLQHIRLNALCEELCYRLGTQDAKRLAAYYAFLKATAVLENKDSLSLVEIKALNQLLSSVVSVFEKYLAMVTAVELNILTPTQLVLDINVVMGDMFESIAVYRNSNSCPDNKFKQALSHAAQNIFYHLSAHCLELVITHEAAFSVLQEAAPFPSTKLRELIASTDHEVASQGAKSTAVKATQLGTVLSVTTLCLVNPTEKNHAAYAQHMGTLLKQRTHGQVFYDALQSILSWMGKRFTSKSKEATPEPNQSSSKTSTQESVRIKPVHSCVGALQPSLPPSPQKSQPQTSCIQ